MVPGPLWGPHGSWEIDIVATQGSRGAAPSAALAPSPNIQADTALILGPTSFRTHKLQRTWDSSLTSSLIVSLGGFSGGSVRKCTRTPEPFSKGIAVSLGLFMPEVGIGQRALFTHCTELLYLIRGVCHWSFRAATKTESESLILTSSYVTL